MITPTFITIWLVLGFLGAIICWLLIWNKRALSILDMIIGTLLIMAGPIFTVEAIVTALICLGSEILTAIGRVIDRLYAIKIIPQRKK